MGFLEPGNNLSAGWPRLAVVIAFAPSQDIVFDAWKTDVLPGRRAWCRCGNQRAGLPFGDAGFRRPSLWLADAKWLGWQGMYWLMAALLDPCIIATLLAPEPTDTIPVPKTLEQAVVAPLRDFFGRNNAWLLLLIVLYKLGDAFAMSLTTTFLIRGVGFDAGEVGVVTKRFLLAPLWAHCTVDFDAAPVAVPGAADFRHLYKVRLTLVTGCCRLLISISTAWARPSF